MNARSYFILFFTLPIAAASQFRSGHHPELQPQSTSLHGDRFRFEVATIKPVDKSPGVNHMIGAEVYASGRVVIPTVTLKGLIATAFDLPFSQISGGEEWMGKEEYDVLAKAPEDSKPYDVRHTWFRIEDSRLREMLKSLLIERFQLKTHRETRTGRVYILMKSGKNIPIKPSDVHPGAPLAGLGTIGAVGDTWGISNTTMGQLANFIGDFYLHCPVLDQTGLSGPYDYKWKMLLTNPDQPDAQLGRKEELMQFLQVMGLKLKPSTGPVETIIIDHAERPSEN